MEALALKHPANSIDTPLLAVVENQQISSDINSFKISIIFLLELSLRTTYAYLEPPYERK